jgi:hypothetical protein
MVKGEEGRRKKGGECMMVPWVYIHIETEAVGSEMYVNHTCRN